MKTITLFLLLLGCTCLCAQNTISVQERGSTDRVQEPVTLGIPFNQGTLTNISNIRITDSGIPQDAQFSVMSNWNDGSIRWVKADFQADVSSGTTATNYQIETGTHSFTTNLSATDNPTDIVVNTGVLRFSVSKTNFNLFNYVDLDLNNNGTYEASERIIDPMASTGAISENAGVQYSSANIAPTEVLIEEIGPMKVVIKLSGRHQNGASSHLKYDTRIYAYANKPYIKVWHAYANDNSMPNLNNTLINTVNVDAYSLNLQLNLSGMKSLRLGGDAGAEQIVNVPTGGTANLIQYDRPTVATPFNYDINQNGTSVASGNRAEGWAIFSDATFAVGVSTQYFWEKYPKGLHVDDTGLLSLQAVTDVSETLYAGMGTGDEYIFWFMPSTEAATNGTNLMALSKTPLLAHCESSRYINSEVFYELENCDAASWPNLDNFTTTVANNHLTNFNTLDLYGNLIFGDVPRGQFEVAADRMQSTWGNNYYDCALTNARLFAQTGDANFFDILQPMARHWMETDCWNTGDGDWLNGYCGMHGPAHRAQPNFNHHYGEGIFYYYYLTGDERALEIGLNAAESIDNLQFWANNNVYLRGAYQRGSVCLEAYKATANAVYLTRARQQIDAIMNTQNSYGLVGNSLDGGATIAGTQSFMIGLFSDVVWKYLQENYDPILRDQLLALADCINTYARVTLGDETYYNFLSSPAAPGPPTPGFTGTSDDFVYWNGKNLVAGLYAYAYDLSGDTRYKSYAENLLNHIWGSNYGDAFGFEFFGKAASQAMKNGIHAAAITCKCDPELDSTVENPIKLCLQGAYDSGTGMMRTDLSGGSPLMPLQEPYTVMGFTGLLNAGISTTNAVLASTGSDAIVDWVLVELRDSGDNTVVLASKAALLQSDGDVVEVDGITPIRFRFANAHAANYYVAIRHRNHLGVMTGAAVVAD